MALWKCTLLKKNIHNKQKIQYKQQDVKNEKRRKKLVTEHGTEDQL